MSVALEQAQIARLSTLPEWTIEPRGEGPVPMLRDVWRYRKLLRFFASRSLQKLYRRTVLGFAWIFIKPLFPLVINTFVFGGVLGVKHGEVPYFIFLVVGNSPWDLFSGIVMWGTRSLELNRGLLARIYIPRLILPIAMGTPSWLNFAINLGVIAVALIGYWIAQGKLYLNLLGIGWAVQACVLLWILGLGISLWTSVPALLARDIRFTLGYVLGFWVFLTPVMYPLSSVPEKYRWVVALNPMTPVVQSFKYGLLGIDSVDVPHLLIAWGVSLVVLVAGLAFFMRAERTAGDKS